MQPIVSIETMPSNWGFGNRVLYFNNLIQIAHRNFSKRWRCVPWDGHQLFSGDMFGVLSEKATHMLPPCLGELFFGWHTISTREIFKLKSDYNVPNKTVAIHFRGTDFHSWNPDSILDVDYYINAINMIDDIDGVILFTDDESLSSFNQVRDYLEKIGIQYEYGDNTSNRDNYAKDFGKMTECDYIISSPSTFCVCAGFIGKHKKIIHSKKWLENRINNNDKFWVDLYNGGNEDYSIWKTA
jgi:hypothetical protein